MTPSLVAEPDTFWTPKALATLTALDFGVPAEQRHIVGIHGYAQSGKDTVAGFLKEHGFTQIRFAEPILDMLVALNPIVSTSNRGQVFRFAEVLEENGYEEAKKTLEFRRLMQVFGTEVGRDMLGSLLGVDTWIDIARRKMEQPGAYTISDVRFMDEASMVRSEGGYLVKVVRPGYAPVNSHLSDAGLPDSIFDVVLHNDGTLDDLKRQVTTFFGSL